MDDFVDVTEPGVVEVLIRADGKVVWVNVDGVCRLRACRVKLLVVEDRRIDTTVDDEEEDEDWRPGATAPKEHGVEIRIKIAHARGVPAYWDAELQTFVLSRPVNVESVREPLGWQHRCNTTHR